MNTEQNGVKFMSSVFFGMVKIANAARKLRKCTGYKEKEKKK